MWFHLGRRSSGDEMPDANSAPQHRIGFQCRRVDADPPALEQAGVGQPLHGLLGAPAVVAMSDDCADGVLVGSRADDRESDGDSHHVLARRSRAGDRMTTKSRPGDTEPRHGPDVTGPRRPARGPRMDRPRGRMDRAGCGACSRSITSSSGRPSPGSRPRLTKCNGSRRSASTGAPSRTGKARLPLQRRAKRPS